MKLLRMFLFVSLLALGSWGNAANAQSPATSDEHKLLLKDIGTWKAEMKMWMAPGMDAQVFEAEETNRMIGKFWSVSDFKGNFGGMPFEGHGTFGYDAKQKRFVGSWVDSSNPYAMHMVGTYDEAKKTMTFKTKGLDASGNEVEGKATTVYQEDGVRLYTMYRKLPGQSEMTKVMEVKYTKVGK